MNIPLLKLESKRDSVAVGWDGQGIVNVHEEEYRHRGLNWKHPSSALFPRLKQIILPHYLCMRRHCQEVAGVDVAWSLGLLALPWH